MDNCIIKLAKMLTKSNFVVFGKFFAIGNVSSNSFFRLDDARKYVAILFRFGFQIFNSGTIAIACRLFEKEPKKTFTQVSGNCLMQKNCEEFLEVGHQWMHVSKSTGPLLRATGPLGPPTWPISKNRPKSKPIALTLIPDWFSLHVKLAIYLN